MLETGKSGASDGMTRRPGATPVDPEFEPRKARMNRMGKEQTEILDSQNALSSGGIDPDDGLVNCFNLLLVFEA